MPRYFAAAEIPAEYAHAPFLQQERDHSIGNLLAHGILLIQHITGVRASYFTTATILSDRFGTLAGTRRDPLAWWKIDIAIAPRWRARNHHNIRSSATRGS